MFPAFFRFASTFLLALSCLAGAASAQPSTEPYSPCGAASAPCKVGLGEYFVASPQPGNQLRPAVLFFHGAGGGGSNILLEQSLLRPFVAAGYVVIGLEGQMRPNNRFGRGWSFLPQGVQQRDELAFTKQVIEDAVPRFHIDRDRILMSGFSIGASLVWYMACKEPTLASAYAPIAGGFWLPMPSSCAGPVNLLQTHGWRDQTVPLEGRPAGGGTVFQGDIFEGLKLWRTVNRCMKLRADEFDTTPPFWRRIWSSCDSGAELVLALHQGSHDETPAEWGPMALQWFETRLKAVGKTH